MKEAIEANNAILKEKARIQRALLKLGYFAYSVKFTPFNGKNEPIASIFIEARQGYESDKDLIWRET